MTFKKLPVNDFPVFTYTIPSTKAEFRFRPFLVKETKALMIAQGTEDKENMIQTLKSVLQSSCLDEGFNVDELSIFDCEYLLLKLRAVSIGEFVSVRIKCDGEHVGNEPRDCTVDVDLKNVEVANIDVSKREVQVSDSSVVYLKYPSVDTLKLLASRDELSPDDFMGIIISCIDKIFINGEMYQHDDLNPDDVKEWLDTLPNMGFTKLVEFFDNLPYVRVKVEFDCPYCGKHNVRYLTGLEVFF